MKLLFFVTVLSKLAYTTDTPGLIPVKFVAAVSFVVDFVSEFIVPNLSLLNLIYNPSHTALLTGSV